jgi:hypothetical protein
MWWGQALLLAQSSRSRLGKSWPGPTYSSFTMRLKIAVWVLHLHTVVRGTLVSGYRQYLTPKTFRKSYLVNCNFEFSGSRTRGLVMMHIILSCILF